MFNIFPLSIEDVKETIYGAQSGVNHRDVEVFTKDGFKSQKCKHFILGQKLNPTDCFDAWLNEAIDTNAEFLCTIYKVQGLNSKLMNKLKPFIKSRFSNEQIQRITFDITLFFGHYKFTPFGVHIDDVDFVYHFNVGYHDKIIYYWDHKPTSFIDKYEPQNILSSSQSETIMVGKMYELNPKKYHIGSSSEGLSFDFILTAKYHL